MSQKKEKIVVIVGGGLAGSCAAIEAAKSGAIVHLFEMEKKIGGNSAKASSGMNGCNTKIQQKSNILDTKDSFLHDTLKSGKGNSNEKLANILVENSAKSVEFLQSFGIKLDELCQCGGHSTIRTHRSKPSEKPINIGFEVMSTLTKEIEKYDNIKVHLNTKVDTLLYKKKVNGVKYLQEGKENELKADAVILTTGGFGANSEILGKFSPKYKNFPTTNGVFAQGDGISLGEQVSAQLIDMDQIQIHPTGFINPKEPLKKSVILAPEAFRGVGAILINSEGKRFVDELQTRDFVTQEILQNCKPITENGYPTSYMLLDDQIIQSFGESICNFYKKFGLIKEYQNFEDFSKKENIPFDNLKATIEEYNKKNCSFGKKVFLREFDLNQKLSVGLITPAIHYTMGGLKFNENSQVINQNDEVIEGLFAAGEVTGGLHGKNRLAGNSLLECVVFGRIAGKSATL
eukprot:gene1539-12665_t